MLVDDNEINVAVGREMIENYGVKISIAQSGEEAINLAQNQQFDMIIMDIRMPDMDGYEATKIIRKMESYKFIPIIALSADVVAGVEEKALSSGINYYAKNRLNPKNFVNS